jgi:hypothetical protein
LSGSSPITTTSPSSKAHQKSGPFAPPALPGVNSVRLPPRPPHDAMLRPPPSSATGLPVTANHPSDVPCPLPRRIAWVRVSIASPPSPIDRRVAAHRIAQRPKAAFVAGLRPSRANRQISG